VPYLCESKWVVLRALLNSILEPCLRSMGFLLVFQGRCLFRKHYRSRRWFEPWFGWSWGVRTKLSSSRMADDMYITSIASNAIGQTKKSSIASL
jgi:hypothetical protein